MTSPTDDHRSGFACFVGRPNVGKSTLTNDLVGTKVAITSTKPQTTRHAIRGIVHRPDAQLIIVDTPGLHRPRTLLGQRLNDLVYETWSEVDVVGFCVPADEKVGPGDRYIAEALAKVAKRTPVVGIVTKTDLVGRDQVAQQLVALQEMMSFTDIVPVSAVDQNRMDVLSDLLVRQLPEGPQLYPDGDLTDEPETTLIAELIREAALEGVRDELPHSIAVGIEEMIPRGENDRDDEVEVVEVDEDEEVDADGDEVEVVEVDEDEEGGEEAGEPGLIDIYAQIYVERKSQKAIIIGRGGQRLRDVGTQARQHIEKLLGTRIYLDLHVKIAKDWQRDPKQLRRLGF